MAEKKRLGILLGDSAGVGPEIVAEVAAEGLISELCEPVIIGDVRQFEQGLKVVKKECLHYVVDETLQLDPSKGIAVLDTGDQDPAKVTMGKVQAYCGAADVNAIRLACRLCAEGKIEGYMYGPLSKGAMIEGGMEQESEAELMGHEFGLTGAYGEINMLGDLMTVRVTSHIPVSEISAHLNQDNILQTIELAYDTSKRFGVKDPVVAVAGLNPHNGEGGKCGREEIDVIAPAIAKAVAKGWNVQGPFPADIVFMRAFKGEFDVVVTMYHDQGQIALKVTGFDSGVTIQGGQPYPITTPAHGTAFGRAGQGRASNHAFKNALKVLVRMAENR